MMTVLEKLGCFAKIPSLESKIKSDVTCKYVHVQNCEFQVFSFLTVNILRIELVKISLQKKKIFNFLEVYNYSFSHFSVSQKMSKSTICYPKSIS